jgi:peptidyl-prolyl cis-trans isomerase D
MSILGSMRQGIDNGTLKVLFFVMVALFVFWGVGKGKGPTSQLIAVVDGTRITDTRFHKMMRNARHSENKPLTEADENDLARRVLESMITDEVLHEQVRKIGIEISDEEIARHILRIDAFKDESGKFSQDLYERNLKRMGTKRSDFENDIRDELALERLQELAIAGVTVTEDEIRQRFTLENTRLDLEVVRVPAMSFYQDVKPAQAEIDAFIAGNGADIDAWYREHYEARYHKTVRADVQMILLRSDISDSDEAALKARLESIQKEVEGGADFGALARRYSEDSSAENGGSIGIVTADGIDPKMSLGIFGDKPDNAQTGLRTATTDRGIELLLVKSILPEEIIPEDTARPEIALSMMQEKEAPKLAADFAQKLHDAWKVDPALPSDLLTPHELTVTHADSVSLADQDIPGLKGMTEIVQALPMAQKGQVLDKVFAAEDAFFVVRVAERVAPDPAGYAADRDRIKTRLLRLEQMAFLQDWRDDLVAHAEVQRLLKLRTASSAD